MLTASPSRESNDPMFKKASLIVLLFILVLVGGLLYYQRAAKCFGSTGALNLPRISEARRGEPIILTFKMLRIAAPGCFIGHTSDSYKNVSCGYRFSHSENWTLGELTVKEDNDTTYEIDCRIPPPSPEVAQSSQLEYYFEFSPWGNPPERKTGRVSIK